MAHERAERARAPTFIDPSGYARHRPEETLLYQLVERYYPELVTARESAGRTLPKYVQEEFEAFLKCGRLEHGFLRVRCEKLVALSCERRGFCPSCGARRMTDSAIVAAVASSSRLACVFAANAALRAAITPAGRGSGGCFFPAHDAAARGAHAKRARCDPANRRGPRALRRDGDGCAARALARSGRNARQRC